MVHCGCIYIFFNRKEKCIYVDLSTSTAAEDLEHKDMDAALCQNSRRRLVSEDEFQYLNVPHIKLIMVYDDFECIFKCLYHPSCISFNLAAEGKLWCEQAHGVQTKQKFTSLFH